MISWHLLRGLLVFFKTPALLSRIMSVVWLMEKIATWNISYLFSEAINGDLFFTVLHFQFVTNSSQISLIIVSRGILGLRMNDSELDVETWAKPKESHGSTHRSTLPWFHMYVIVPVLSTIIPKQILICGCAGFFIWTLRMIMILEKALLEIF